MYGPMGRRRWWCIHAVGNQTNILKPKGPNETKMWVEQPLALCFQVTEGEGYPEATQTRRVRRLLGEVLQLPGEQAADGILTVTCHPLICLSWADSTFWSSDFFSEGILAYVVLHSCHWYGTFYRFLGICKKYRHRPGMIQYSAKYSDQENTCTIQIWSDLSLLFLNIPSDCSLTNFVKQSAC